VVLLRIIQGMCIVWGVGVTLRQVGGGYDTTIN